MWRGKRIHESCPFAFFTLKTYSSYLLEWIGSDAWVQKAGSASNANTIRTMLVFQGELYAGTGPYSKLLKWNGVDAWIDLAGQHEAEQYLMALVVFNGSLFACTGLGSPNGYLLQWNGTEWIKRATAGTAKRPGCLQWQVVHGKWHGRLFCWNGTDAFTEVAGILNYTSGSKLVAFRK